MGWRTPGWWGGVRSGGAAWGAPGGPASRNGGRWATKKAMVLKTKRDGIGQARKKNSAKTGETRQADPGSIDGRGRHTDRRQRHPTVAIRRLGARTEKL